MEGQRCARTRKLRNDVGRTRSHRLDCEASSLWNPESSRGCVMKKIALGLLLTVTSLFFAPAKADIVYNTFLTCTIGTPFCSADGREYNARHQYEIGIGFEDHVHDVAMAFTPARDYTLDSIEVIGEGGFLNNVFLMSDSTGVPGSILESFQVTFPNEMLGFVAPFELATPRLLSSLLHPLLTAGTQFWLAMSAADPTNSRSFLAVSGRLRVTASEQTTGPVAFREDAGSWLIQTDDQPAFAVRGSVVAAPIPEPETYAMMLAGLGLVGWMAKRRRSEKVARA
jgi:hypothetical protein